MGRTGSESGWWAGGRSGRGSGRGSPYKARGYGRGHMVGVQGTPAIFLFSFYLTDFDSTPSNSQLLKTSRTPTGPAKASPHPPSVAPHPFQHVPLPVLHPLPPRHKEHDPGVTFFVSGVSPHPLPPRHLLCTFYTSGASLHPTFHPLPPRHEECNHMVAFFVSGVFPHSP